MRNILELTPPEERRIGRPRLTMKQTDDKDIHVKVAEDLQGSKGLNFFLT